MASTTWSPSLRSLRWPEPDDVGRDAEVRGEHDLHIGTGAPLGVADGRGILAVGPPVLPEATDPQPPRGGVPADMFGDAAPVAG